MAEKNILGIDLRVCSVKVVELKKDTNGYTVTGWGMDEVQIDLADKHPDKEIAQAKTLKRLLASGRMKAKRAVVVVGGSDVLVKKIVLPPLVEAEVREAIKWKIKDEITYPIEEAVIDYSFVFKTREKVEYIATVAQRSTINRVLEVMRLAQLKILRIIPVPLALVETFAKETSPTDIVSMIYMGRRTTNISFFRGKTFLFNREVSLGGEDITRAMTSVVVSEEGRLELKFEEAERIKMESGIPIDLESYPKLGEIPLAHLQAVIRPALEKVEDEILRTLEYFKGQEGEVEIKKVILCGGSSRTPHLMEFLSSGLGVNFVYVDPLKGVTVDSHINDQGSLTSHQAQMAGALGAALSNYAAGLNLLPEEIRDRVKLMILKHLNPVEVSAVLAVLMIAIYLLMTWQSFYMRSEMMEISGKLDLLKPQLSRLEELEKALKEEEGRRGVFKLIELNRIKIAGVLEDISLNMPESALMNQVTVNESAREVHLLGTVFKRGDTAENILSGFIYKLSNIEDFDKVELIQATKNEGYLMESFDFDIVGKIKKKTL